jgi:exosortase C (VPDSG-CTERM-specific)
MQETQKIANPAQNGRSLNPASSSTELRNFLRAAGVLVLCFALPLWRLFKFAAGSEMYSYILLMPFVSGYLIHLQKPQLLPDSPPRRLVGGLFFAAGAGIAIWHMAVNRVPGDLEVEESLAMTSMAFLCCLYGAAFWFLGRNRLKVFAFPLAMQLFILTIPNIVMDDVQEILDHGSALITVGFFHLAGTPVTENFKEAYDLVLSDITLRVAPECSGIHSTWILLITSLLAGHLFLRSPRKRAALTLFVIPLAFLRNGFRIFTIGELCVHIGPQMIDSVIHRHGGPFFFVLSLIPFFAALALLRRMERNKTTPAKS